MASHRSGSRVLFWVGWVFSAVPILFMGVGGIVFYLLKPSMVSDGTAKLGYPAKLVPLIVALEVGSALLYALPPTAVLGAVLMTGYLGGAVASHVRVSDPQWPSPVIAGVLVWLGLFLRDPRVRALLPFRFSPR